MALWSLFAEGFPFTVPIAKEAESKLHSSVICVCRVRPPPPPPLWRFPVVRAHRARPVQIVGIIVTANDLEGFATSMPQIQI